MGGTQLAVAINFLRAGASRHSRTLSSLISVVPPPPVAIASSNANSSSSSSSSSLIPLSSSPNVAWELFRLSWLARGLSVPVPEGAAGDVSLCSAAEAVEAARAARKRTAEAVKPLRIREHNVLAALRDPLRLVEFNRPMPLPAMVALMILLWDEESVAVAQQLANKKR